MVPSSAALKLPEGRDKHSPLGLGASPSPVAMPAVGVGTQLGAIVKLRSASNLKMI